MIAPPPFPALPLHTGVGGLVPALDATALPLAALPGFSGSSPRGDGGGRLLLPGQPALWHGDASAPQLPPVQRAGGEQPDLRRAGVALELLPGAPGRPRGGAARVAVGLCAGLWGGGSGAWLLLLPPPPWVACSLVSW